MLESFFMTQFPSVPLEFPKLANAQPSNFGPLRILCTVQQMTASYLRISLAIYACIIVLGSVYADQCDSDHNTSVLERAFGVVIQSKLESQTAAITTLLSDMEQQFDNKLKELAAKFDDKIKEVKKWSTLPFEGARLRLYKWDSVYYVAVIWLS